MYAIFRGPDGQVVGAANDYGLFLRPNTNSSSQVPRLDSVPDADLDATEIYVDPGLL